MIESKAEVAQPFLNSGRTLRLSLEARSTIRHASLVLFLYSALFTAFFSPVLFGNSLLSPGDSFLYYLPNFYAPKVMWEPLILCGAPVFADPQAMLWYPMSLLFSSLNLWNAFILSAYVLTSCFTYGYVYTLTSSRLAASVSGLVNGLSGFMMAHLGHATMIHGAVWLPLIIWSLEVLRVRFSKFWLVIGSTAVACSFLAGHPQIFVYTQLVCAAFTIIRGWHAPVGRWRFFFSTFLFFTLGIGLAGIQLLPTIELSAWSVREQMNFSEFTSYSMPLRQLSMILFPYIFGGSDRWYGMVYFGKWNIAELTGYVGLLPLMLAGVGILAWPRKSVSLFWVGIVVVSLLLTLGDATPLAKLAFHLPVVNKFRVPARHFLEMTFAVSLLSGFGVTSILRGTSRSLVVALCIVTAGITLAVLSSALLFRDYSLALATSQGIESLSFSPWVNKAIGVPLVLLMADAVILIYWSRRPQSKWRTGALALLLLLDLSSFGWFCYWRGSPAKSSIEPPETARILKPQLGVTHQRLMPVRGGLGGTGEVLPTISRLWGIPSASGYGPLLLRRVGKLASMNPGGVVEFSSLNPEDQSLNLLAVRFLTLPLQQSELMTPGIGQTKWAVDDLDLSVGASCGASSSPVQFNLPTPILTTKIGIVCFLGCASDIPDGFEVARIKVTDNIGQTSDLSLVAGRDSSEWSYDCTDVRALMHHQRANIYSSFPVSRDKAPCEGHKYLATLPLPKPTTIKRLDVSWVAREGVLSIRKVSLIDEQRGLSFPIKTGSISLPDKRWRYVDDFSGASVYENLYAQPRVWLVPETVSLSSESVIKAIKTSRLPDGRTFDPAQVALVENDRFAFKEEAWDHEASATVVELRNSRMKVSTNATSQSFLVTSDVYYPGWAASVDGIPVSVAKVDYALRGVKVPAGNHTVIFEFKPRTFYVGAAISITSLLLLVLTCLIPKLRVRHPALSGD